MGEPFLGDFKLMRRRYEQLFRKIIDEGIAQKVFRQVDPILITRTLLSATNWTFESFKSFRSLGKLSPSEISEQITSILIEGIITR